MWEFDVGVTTHDLLRQGVTVHHYRRITVLAETYDEASLTAYYMAQMRSSDVVVSDILWRY